MADEGNVRSAEEQGGAAAAKREKKKNMGNRKIVMWGTAVIVALLIVVIISMACQFFIQKAIVLQMLLDLGGGSAEVINAVAANMVPTPAEALSVLIAIFGVVVSIWVGLNIYNVIGKDDLDKMERETEEITERFKNKIDSLEDKVETSTEDMEQDNIRISETSFIESASVTLAYYPTGDFILAGMMKKVEHKLDHHKLLLKLVETENYCNATSNADAGGQIKTRVDIARKGLGCCAELKGLLDEYEKSENHTSDILDFLNGFYYLRVGDFNYFISYRADEDRYDEAVDDYCNAVRSWFHIDIKAIHRGEAKLWESIGADRQENDIDLRCLAYFFNVIGESYNVRAQKDFIGKPSKEEQREFEKKARTYFESAISIVEKLKVLRDARATGGGRRVGLESYFATYCRNYGTVLERLGETEEDRAAALEQYREALAINPADSNSYYTYSSFYLKKLNAKMLGDVTESMTVQPLGAAEADKYRADIRENVAPYIVPLKYQRPSDVRGFNLDCWANSLLACLAEDAAEREHYFGVAEELLRVAKAIGGKNESTEKNELRIKGLRDFFANRADGIIGA